MSRNGIDSLLAAAAEENVGNKSQFGVLLIDPEALPKLQEFAKKQKIGLHEMLQEALVEYCSKRGFDLLRK